MWIIDINRMLSSRLESYFPHSANTISDNYPAIVGRFAENGRVIVDVGGGAQCAFAEECAGSHIIAVDISPSVLERNRQVLIGESPTSRNEFHFQTNPLISFHHASCSNTCAARGAMWRKPIGF
jgi:ubiquinone/menaquinone biosynthesis C-methylase UbiE